MNSNELAAHARRAAGMEQTIGALEYASVNAVLTQAAQRYASKPAFSCLGATLRFDDLNRLSAAFASWLQHHTDLQPGDRIAIQLPNLLQYPVVCLGAMRAGLIVVNTNPLYTQREMEHQFRDSGASALVLLANIGATAQDVIPRTAIRHVITTEVGDLHPLPKLLLMNGVMRYVKKRVPPFSIPGALRLRDALARGARAAHREAVPASGDVAVLQYTGGTTGVSKGAMLSHGNIVANVQQVGALTASYDFVDGGELLLLPLPLYHIYAFNACLGMLARGCHTVLVPDPRDLGSLVDAFRDWKPTGFAGLNTLFVALCNDARFRGLDFSRLKITMSGGMALRSDAARRWQETTGCQVVEGYGLTETSPTVSVNPVNANRLGTIGIPVPSTEVKLIDEAGDEVQTGEPGELCVRGPQVMLGYWQRPEETASVLDSEGWLKTGDVALMTEEGYLKIVDRKKDMIVVSGFNVYPNEVEDVATEHPGVLECAAIGVADERTGEAVVLHVVRSDASLGEEALREFCRANLTAYKVPRHIVFHHELPKSNVGKILRRELRGHS